VVLIIKVLGVVGIGGIFAALIAVPAVAYLGLMIYKTPGLIEIIIETGVGLINTGKERVEAFNKIAESVKG
jgi:hypothetical protein